MDIKEKALTRIPAPIQRVHRNPFRNFDLNPIRKSQVELLQAGIEDIGMWSGLAARKIPDSTPAEYQLACGHHRLEALKKAGIDTVNLDVRPYSDKQMIRIMVEENMTQRGNENVGTVLDSVGAVIVQVVRESNLGDNRTPNHIESRLLKADGIGHKTICNRQPTISERNARHAIHILKVCGKYADLIEQGGAPKEVVNLYRADEAESNPNILKAVSMFKKAAHGEAFAGATMVDAKMCDLPEENYIECAQNILVDDQRVTQEIVERKVFGFFSVTPPTNYKVSVSQQASPRVDPQTSRQENKPEATNNIGETQGEPVQSTQAPETNSTSTHTETSSQAIDEGVITTSEADSTASLSDEDIAEKLKELCCNMEMSINCQIESGWPVMTRSGVITFLSKLIEMIVINEAEAADFSIEEAFADRAASWLDKIDDCSKWQATIKKMKRRVDETIPKAA